ncbi:FAD-binding oxidoreductase [Chloroflexota bacterium]
MSGAKTEKSISEEAYQALEAVVGSKYITVNPAECQAYNGRGCYMEIYWWQNISRRPICVVLPKTTEEVAGIIKACNLHNIPYFCGSAFGWLPISSGNLRDDFLCIDLKRMDSMAIDEKNMYTLVEPGVVYAHLQAEAMKRDLYTMVPGAGGGTSVLGNQITAGIGSLCYRITASSVRRMNGLEWVTPEGEIVRMGSLVNGDDNAYWRGGLGPGLVGLVKGYSAWAGSMGIVTKMALKLYPFQPERLEPDGIGGDSCVKLPPDRIRFYGISFPTEEALQKVMREIGEAQITSYINRVSVFWRYIAKARGSEEYRRLFWDSWGQMTREKTATIHIARVMIIGYASPKQLEYEEKVLTDIVEENGGKLRQAKQTDESCFMLSNSPDVWMMTGYFASLTIGTASLRCAIKTGDEFRRRWEEGYLDDAMDQHHEVPWYMPLDQGRQGYAETDAFSNSRKLDPQNPLFDQGIMMRSQEFQESVMPLIETTTGFPSVFSTTIGCSYTSDATRFNTPVWVERFQKEFNPHGLAAAGFPYLGDKLEEIMPGVITDEFKETVKRVQSGNWRGQKKRPKAS